MSIALRVLIVEDSPDDAELIMYHLEEAGFQPTWVRIETEEEFLTALKTLPDIILSDWSLPKFSGIRALQRLHELGQNTPFIIVSGNAREETATDARRMGADDYVLKDRLAGLGQAVHRALEADVRRRI